MNIRKFSKFSNLFNPKGSVIMEWNRAEVALKRFESVASVSLDTLDTHRLKIQSFRNEGNTPAVGREEVNMERTVQSLIRSLRSISTVCADLDIGDRDRFHNRIRPIRNRIQMILSEIEENDNARYYETASSSSFSFSDRSSEQNENDNFYSDPLLQAQKLKDIDELKQRAAAVEQEAEAHQKLARDIEELQEVMCHLGQMVHSQGEVVDSIEANIENAQENMRHGEGDLKKAQRYKTASYPLAVGLFGAAVAGGPVSFLIGAKVACLAAVGGAVAGVFGGRYLKRSVDQDATPTTHITAEEMTSLSKDS